MIVRRLFVVFLAFISAIVLFHSGAFAVGQDSIGRKHGPGENGTSLCSRLEGKVGNAIIKRAEEADSSRRASSSGN